MKNEKRNMVAGHTCLGYKTSTSDGCEFDCEYGPDFPCDECVFVVGDCEGDYRKGKRPWAKRWEVT